MTLRKKIEEIITKEQDHKKAAIEICKFLDDEIGLSGNGWFDDDQTMCDILSEEEDEE